MRLCYMGVYSYLGSALTMRNCLTCGSHFLAGVQPSTMVEVGSYANYEDCLPVVEVGSYANYEDCWGLVPRAPGNSLWFQCTTFTPAASGSIYHDVQGRLWFHVPRSREALGDSGHVAPQEGNYSLTQRAHAPVWNFFFYMR